MRATALGVLAHPSDWSTVTIRFSLACDVPDTEVESLLLFLQDDINASAINGSVIYGRYFIVFILLTNR